MKNYLVNSQTNLIKIAGKLFLPFIFFAIASGVSGQGINKTDWTVLSEENKASNITDTVFLDKSCVKLDGSLRSAIWNKAVQYKNFRIELDIAGSVMAGIGFHVADEQNYQFIYFRPGYGGTEEAIQYIPVYNGALSWVMYGAYQNIADIKRLEWFHAAVEVRGDNLKVFTNYKPKPDMNITMQRTKADKGSILLRTMFGPSYFANVSVKELPEPITNWEISGLMPTSILSDFNQIKKVDKWTKISDAGDSYVNLCRYFDYPQGALFAKHTLHSDADDARLLSFDFIGKLHIVLNGKEIFNYEKYKLDRIAEGANRIKINLKQGSNELVFITEGDSYIFGKGYNSLGRLQHQNWGFIANIGKL
ncbi:MAG TPA: family 16 glycoside hydrolase [Chitinophagaceae bacterium]|nr:family 16 glycoside hydrolase [Chitinophagaceae bacterium]